MTTLNATSFVVYRWKNPRTTSDYPFLAVAQDKTALLSLGDYGATLDWGIPDEATNWLTRDFMPTGEILECDLSQMKCALRALFPGDAEFASVRFGAELLPSESERFVDVMGMDDPVIEINLTPNRPDATAVYGIARDLAASGLGKLKDGAVVADSKPQLSRVA